MRALTGGVNAGIGPPCADHANFFAGDLAQCAFQFVLHGALARLNLEPLKIRPVILDDCQETHWLGQLVTSQLVISQLVTQSLITNHQLTSYASRSTNSKITTGAASPRRGPTLKMRV